MKTNGKKDSLQDMAIITIQKDVEFIKCDIAEIKNNHLHGIVEEIKGLHTEIEALKQELNARPTWTITFLASLCMALIIFVLTNYFLK